MTRDPKLASCGAPQAARATQRLLPDRFADPGHLLILLRNKSLSRRPNSGDLDDHFTILRPGVMRSLRGFGIERAGGIGRELAFIPLLARREVERSGEHRDRTHLVGMPMGGGPPTRPGLDPGDEHPRPCRDTA